MLDCRTDFVYFIEVEAGVYWTGAEVDLRYKDRGWKGKYD